jgi:hypothetical protein
MTDHDRGTVNRRCWTEDVLPVSQGSRRWMGPSCTIQRKQLETLRRNLPDEVPFQPLLILASPLDGSVTTVPLAAEDRQKTQLRKRTDGSTEK